MEKIALPKNIKFEKGEKAHEGVVVVEPCYPGYGVTLGNSLRRVLISSLPGAAVVGVKIKGADHEFMTVPNVKEDVLEILLNLKQLRLKVYSDEEIRLTLKVHGEKEVTAADIEKNAEVEVINTDMVIGHITDMSGSLEMEIVVQSGRGYETIESRERAVKHEIGYIEVDSPYSPILNVGINVESVRVGKMTNWDKLILTITTDGTISVEDAFKQSVEVLINQFQALAAIQSGESVKEVVEGVAEVIEDEEEEKKPRGRKKEED